MRLVLLRHGPAGERDPAQWPSDAERPLTEKGEARSRAAAKGIVSLERRIVAVLTSPFRRCDQTARVLTEVAELPDARPLDALAPGGSWREVIAALVQHHGEAAIGERDTVVVVGHEPDLGKLAGVLLFGAPRSLPLKKAGACALEFDGPPAPGGATLRWFLGPRPLRQLATRRKVTS